MYPLLAALWMLAAPASLQQRSELAKQALLKGRAADAVARYRALVKELPGDPGMRLNLALALESAGEYAEEIRQLQLVTKARQDLFAPWLLLGMAHQKLSQPEAALEPLRHALTLTPDHPLALLELADARFTLGNLSEAEAGFKRLVAVSPDSPKGWKGLALTYTALAQENFTRLERDAPGSAEWCLLAGRSEMNDGHFARAFALFRQAAKQQPDLRGVHEALAEVYKKTDHSDWAAIEIAKEAGAKAESRHESFRAAETYQKLAADAFAQLERLPESAELLELKAAAAQRQGWRAEALSEWRRAVQLAPSDRRLQGKLAESLWTNRSYEEAEKLLVQLTAANPNEAQWRYLLGDTLFRERKSEAAATHLEAALRLRPDLLAAHAVLGRIYLQLGRPALAIPHLLTGLPTDEAAISFQLGQAYRATGQSELAARAFQRGQELNEKAKGPTSVEITPPED